jgi:DNA primase small subunit
MTSGSYFHNREFSFTIRNPDEIYCRYQSYKNSEELKKDLVNKTPEKIDIGAVFNFAVNKHIYIYIYIFFMIFEAYYFYSHTKPNKDKKDLLKALEKEFVIDIDMDDFNSVRVCC